MTTAYVELPNTSRNQAQISSKEKHVIKLLKSFLRTVTGYLRKKCGASHSFTYCRKVAFPTSISLLPLVFAHTFISQYTT